TESAANVMAKFCHFIFLFRVTAVRRALGQQKPGDISVFNMPQVRRILRGDALDEKHDADSSRLDPTCSTQPCDHIPGDLVNYAPAALLTETQRPVDGARCENGATPLKRTHCCSRMRIVILGVAPRSSDAMQRRVVERRFI